MSRISEFVGPVSSAPHVAPVETELIISKCLVADFSSSMIECPRLFVSVDIILTDVQRRRLPSAGPHIMATLIKSSSVKGRHRDPKGITNHGP